MNDCQMCAGKGYLDISGGGHIPHKTPCYLCGGTGKAQAPVAPAVQLPTDLRDYFAAKAMQAALANATLPGLYEGDPEDVAIVAKMCTCTYKIADAMLIARDPTSRRSSDPTSADFHGKD